MSSLLLKEKPTVFDADAPPLDASEAAAAYAELSRPNYRCLERSALDPRLPDQNVALFSFVAAPPDNKFGVLAFAKIRGVFATEAEARRYARKLITEVDSVNHIHHVKVGYPFPLFADGRGNDYDDVNAEADFDRAEADFAEAQERRERRSREEMRRRADGLRRDVDPSEPRDPVDEYNTKRQKYVSVAQLYKQYVRLVEATREVLVDTRRAIREMETPEILGAFMKRYEDKMRECGGDADQSLEAQQSRRDFRELPEFDFTAPDYQPCIQSRSASTLTDATSTRTACALPETEPSSGTY